MLLTLAQGYWNTAIYASRKCFGMIHVDLFWGFRLQWFVSISLRSLRRFRVCMRCQVGVFILEVLGRMMMMMMMMMMMTMTMTMMMMMMMMMVIVITIISSISLLLLLLLLLLCMKWWTTMSSLAALCTFHQQSRYVNGRWLQLLENRGAPIRWKAPLEEGHR